jgi:hypothetical protein
VLTRTRKVPVDLGVVLECDLFGTAVYLVPESVREKRQSAITT